jgi:hypothetical protein
VSLLPLILLVEVVTRFLLLHSIPDNVVCQPVDADALLGVDRDALTAYTKQLEAIGFTPLMDYQIAESSIGVARLFAHAEYYCFAEVSEFIGRTSVSCLIASVLEQNWRLGTTNRSKNLVSAIAYAFFRQPRNLGTYESGVEPPQLLQSHLALRQQMMTDLHLQLLPDLSVQSFFDLSQRGRTQQKQALWRKSILVCLVEMLLFSLNPKDEWLGEYAGLAARQHRN